MKKKIISIDCVGCGQKHFSIWLSKEEFSEVDNLTITCCGKQTIVKKIKVGSQQCIVDGVTCSENLPLIIHH